MFYKVYNDGVNTVARKNLLEEETENFLEK